MNVEERSGYQPHPKNNESENQGEQTGLQKQSQERKSVYRKPGEASAQTQDTPRSPSARRPRIKDSQRINYDRQPINRPEDGNNRENVGRQSYSPFSEQRERRPIQSSRTPQRPTYTQRPNVEEGGNERPRTGSYNRPNSPNMSRRGLFDKNAGLRQRNTDDYNPNKKYSLKKQLKYKEQLTDPNEPIRLNKFLANAGVCSRREADMYIQTGAVKVNDQVITELGTKISRLDTVMFQDQRVKIESKIYILLNKPKNCVTTTEDPEERLTVMKLVKSACDE